MDCKTVEIRDAATFIPALAVRLTPFTEQDRYLLARAGFGRFPLQQGGYVMLARLAGGDGQATSDPYGWNTRTMTIAHDWIIKHFDEIESGAVVDVEYILGKRTEPKVSESVEHHV